MRILSDRQGVVLAIVLVGSMALRLWGSGFGLPAFTHYHPDEHALVHRAAGILQTGEWRPERFNYPPLYAYIQVGGLAATYLLGQAAGWWGAMPDYPFPQYFHVARATTALFGTLTVLVVYLAGSYLGTRTGLLAAALLGANYLHIIHSHYATLDVAAGFWGALSLFFSLAWCQRGGAQRGIMAGLCAGLAGATKYNAALVAMVPLCVPFIARVTGRPLTQFGLPLAGFLLGFAAGNPFAVLHWSDFLRGVSTVLEHYGTAQPGFEGLGNWRWYLGILFTSVDAVVMAVCLAGLLGLMARQPRRGLLLLAFPAAYFGLVSSLVVRFERNLVPILPFLALGGGWLLATVSRRLRLQSCRAGILASILAAVLVLALPLAAALAFDCQLASTDHRETAGRWLEQNVKPGARIAIEHYAIPFDHAPYEVADVVRITDYDLAWYRQSGYDLLVVSDGVWEVLRSQGRYYEERLAAYDRLTAGTRLMAEFVPHPPGIVVAGYPSVGVYHFAPVRIYGLAEGG
jgi:4-amino-4-deoxy-L-arabinose transferase-like glycosyltransferase